MHLFAKQINRAVTQTNISHREAPRRGGASLPPPKRENEPEEEEEEEGATEEDGESLFIPLGSQYPYC